MPDVETDATGIITDAPPTLPRRLEPVTADDYEEWLITDCLNEVAEKKRRECSQRRRREPHGPGGNLPQLHTPVGTGHGAFDGKQASTREDAPGRRHNAVGAPEHGIKEALRPMP